MKNNSDSEKLKDYRISLIQIFFKNSILYRKKDSTQSALKLLKISLNYFFVHSLFSSFPFYASLHLLFYCLTPLTVWSPR